MSHITCQCLASRMQTSCSYERLSRALNCPILGDQLGLGAAGTTVRGCRLFDEDREWRNRPID